MANKYQVVDEVLRQQGVEGTYNVTFTNLNITDTENTESVEVVGAISDKVKENLKYSDLNEAPGIPEEGYEEVNEQEVVKDFHKVAFTGDYDHLENAPQIPAGIDRTNGVTFNEIAFTGNIELDNVQVSNVINFYGADAQPPSNNQLRITPPSDETHRLITDDQIATFNTVLSLFGQDDAYVLGFNPVGGSPLVTAITSFYTKFKNTQLPSFFITKAGIFFVLNAIQPSTIETDYIQFDLAQVNTIDYNNTIRDDLANLFRPPISLDENGTNTNAQEILNDITFTSKRVSFIFDFIKQMIICKVQEGTGEGVNAEDIDVTDLQGLADVAISGSYADLLNAPSIPNEGIETITTIVEGETQTSTTIKPFHSIAFTGNYNDLNNNYFTINFGDFIYQKNGENDYELIANTFNMNRCGIVPFAQTEINKLYSVTFDAETNQFINPQRLLDMLTVLRLNFNFGKLCYLITSESSLKLLITNVTQTQTYFAIECQFINNNFNTLMSSYISKTTLTNEEIETIKNSINLQPYNIYIFIDTVHNILFSTPQSVLPFTTIDINTLNINNGILTVNISDDINNNLQINANGGLEVII